MSSEKKKEASSDDLMKYRYLVSERRFLLANLTQMQLDLEEHKLVAEALKGVDDSRKCFRRVGGILCQLTVKDVVPIISLNAEQLEKYIEDVTHEVEEKDKEIESFKKKFGGDLKDQSAEEEINLEKSPTHGVLVGKSY